MNLVNVLFFATLRDRTGQRQALLELAPDASVADFKMSLVEKFPTLKPVIESTLISVNKEYAFNQDLIPAGAEIALFPPVSGGGFPTVFAVTELEIDLDDLLAQITLPSTGAACIFTGMVRGDTRRGNAHLTEYLEYEAYVPMAELKMQQVAEEIRSRWSTVEGIAIVQRIGRLFPGTPTVLIACTAPHRDTGVFEAARYGIDRLKEIVPIWKKEAGPSGEIWIEGDYIPNEQD
jgi:molybdopterin synthase catalytic subunit/molybdopterin converting factor small subunit